MKRGLRGYFVGEVALYPNVHFLSRQAAREKVAAKKALTEAARVRHLTLAEHYQKRADDARAAGA
jgi:hypothetical protein